LRKRLEQLWDSEVVRFLRESVLLYFSCRAPQAAACLAYFLLLTVFPLLICVSYILGMVNIDIASFITSLESVLPKEALSVLSGYLGYISAHQGAGLFIAGLMACWFSAAAAFRTITRVILDVYTEVSQSMVRGMVVSVAFPLALLLTIDLSVLVVTTGQRTLEVIGAHLPFDVESFQPWSWLRYLLLFSIFYLFLLAVFTLAAPRGTPRVPMMLSGLVCALALVTASALFSWFIGLSSRYSLVYGSLVSIIILLVWLYLCGQILFLGIIFTSVWYKRRPLKGVDLWSNWR
jgi:membrane protein